MPEQVSSYRLEEEIAHGGMGVVYRGVHTIFDEVVAIKAIFPELTVNPELRERFVNEAKIQRRLQHPNIVQIREFLIDQGKFYIVMEFVEGETLAGKMKRLGGRMPMSEALEIFRQALAGLGFAHSQGVIHRDIKPSNIMLTREGTAKLTDFGIARVVGAAQFTRSGYVLGTPAYMAPEQIQGKKVDHHADIYSMGITLYETLAGRVPFERPDDSDSDFNVLAAHINQPPEPPSRYDLTIPAFVEAAILKALSKRPEERFASCEEFEAALKLPVMPTTKVAVAAPLPVTVVREPTATRIALPSTGGAVHEPPLSKQQVRSPQPKVVQPALPKPLSQKPAAPKPEVVRTGQKLWLWAIGTLGTVLVIVGLWFYQAHQAQQKTVVQHDFAAPAVTVPAQQSPSGAQKEPTASTQTTQTPPRPVNSPPQREKKMPQQTNAAKVHETGPTRPTAAELAAQIQPLLDQGKSAMEKGDYAGAILAYQRALNLDPASQAALAGLDRAQKAKAAEAAIQ